MLSGKKRDEVSAKPARTTVVTVIGADLVVKGQLSSSGVIQVDGRVEGDVHSSKLIIGAKALMLGDVVAEDVIVLGEVRGNIRARKVHLSSTSRIHGDILQNTFSIEPGASFEGNCRHADNPLDD